MGNEDPHNPLKATDAWAMKVERRENLVPKAESKLCMCIGMGMYMSM